MYVYKIFNWKYWGEGEADEEILIENKSFTIIEAHLVFYTEGM